jgi:hypothetical protein
MPACFHGMSKIGINYLCMSKLSAKLLNFYSLQQYTASIVQYLFVEAEQTLAIRSCTQFARHRKIGDVGQ